MTITPEAGVTDPPHLSAARDHRLVADYDLRFEAIREKLVRTCVGLVGADHAEDVVHDAYLRGRSRFAQLRDVDLFDAWLTRLAMNLCVNRRRSEGRMRSRLPALGRDPQALSRDAGLRELIEGLDPRERTLVVLHYGYGYQLDEIARMVGLSSGNVRSIVFRARRRLGAQLAEADR